MRAIRVIGRVGVYAHPIVAGPTVGGREVAQIEVGVDFGACGGVVR